MTWERIRWLEAKSLYPEVSENVDLIQRINRVKTKVIGESWQGYESGPQISEFSWKAEAIRSTVRAHKRKKDTCP